MVSFRALIYRLCRKYTHQRSGTVRYAFPVTVIFSALLGVALTISSNVSYVRIDTTPDEVRAGETFTINIYASAHVPTNAVDIKVAYPENQLDIMGIDVGESVITIWTEDPYARDGYIYVRGGVFRRGFLGEHLIAKVNARAKESGVARILASETTFIAGDGKGTIVDVSETGAEKAELTIGGVENVPPGELKSDVTIGIVTDIDGDGDVDTSDIQNFLSAWHSRRSAFDFNGDGKMTFRDFAILLAHSFFK